MHTQGVEERLGPAGEPMWFVRSECLGCGLRVGADVAAGEASGGTFGLVDRLIWSDDAKHRLERLPPYVQELLKPEVERTDAGTWRMVPSEAWDVQAVSVPVEQ